MKIIVSRHSTRQRKGARASARFIAEIAIAFGMAAIIFASFVARSAETNFSLPPETAQLKPGPGSDLAVANCSLCHSADYISIQPRFTRAVWKAEVTKMQQKYGAPITTNNIDALADYLTANYGKDTVSSESGTTQAPGTNYTETIAGMEKWISESTTLAKFKEQLATVQQPAFYTDMRFEKFTPASDADLMSMRSATRKSPHEVVIHGAATTKAHEAVQFWIVIDEAVKSK